MQVMELTLVAFYDSKPDPCSQLMNVLQTSLHSELGSAFTPYALDEVHATIIGLGGWRVGAEVYGTNIDQSSGGSFTMDLCGLFQFLQEMSPLHIRIGGFSSEIDYHFTGGGRHP
jgi:hypothetical protein